MHTESARIPPSPSRRNEICDAIRTGNNCGTVWAGVFSSYPLQTFWLCRTDFIHIYSRVFSLSHKYTRITTMNNAGLLRKTRERDLHIIPLKALLTSFLALSSPVCSRSLLLTRFSVIYRFNFHTLTAAACKHLLPGD